MVTSAADDAASGSTIARSDVPAARRRQARRIPWGQGVRRQAIVGWLFVTPALVMYGVFVLQPLALTVQYSLFRWDGVGPVRPGWDWPTM